MDDSPLPNCSIQNIVLTDRDKQLLSELRRASAMGASKDPERSPVPGLALPLQMPLALKSRMVSTETSS